MRKSRFFGLCMLITVFQLLLYSNVYAKDVYNYKAIALKPNVTVMQKDSDYKYSGNDYIRTYYYYKVVAPSEGFFTVSVKKGKSTSFNAYLNVNKKLDPNTDNSFYWRSNENINMIPVSKGIYYFWTQPGQTIKYKFTKVTQKKNYCVGKALPLKKGKKEVVCQTPKYNFNRWFKISLPKKQAITLWFYEDDWCDVYDEELNYIELEHASSSSPKWFTKKMPKGDYYIKVSSSGYSNYNNTSYVHTLYWK